MKRFGVESHVDCSEGGIKKVRRGNILRVMEEVAAAGGRLREEQARA